MSPWEYTALRSKFFLFKIHDFFSKILLIFYKHSLFLVIFSPSIQSLVVYIFNLANCWHSFLLTSSFSAAAIHYFILEHISPFPSHIWFINFKLLVFLISPLFHFFWPWLRLFLWENLCTLWRAPHIASGQKANKMKSVQFLRGSQTSGLVLARALFGAVN